MVGPGSACGTPRFRLGEGFGRGVQFPEQPEQPELPELPE